MPRRQKQKIKVNSADSLEGLLQEVYNDACSQINDAQRTINELASSVTVEDVDDAAKVAKAKTDAQKIKDSGVKIKLEVGRLLKDVLKNSGNVDDTVRQISGQEKLSDGFATIRQMIKDSANQQEDNTDES